MRGGKVCPSLNHRVKEYLYRIQKKSNFLREFLGECPS